MKKKILGFLTLSFCVILNVSAEETVKVLFYDLGNDSLETAVPNREDDLEFIRSDEQPDLFLESPFSFAIRNALPHFNDDLPLRLSIKTNATLGRINTVKTSDTFYLEKTIVSYKLERYVKSFELKNKDLVLFNSIGQMAKILSTNLDDRQEFDVSDWSSGMYFIGCNTISVEPLKFIIPN
jgi:hypothetical protein